MKQRVLITTTSFFDTPGRHLQLLEQSGLSFEPARGPLHAKALCALIAEKGPFDAFICGEDEVNESVIAALAPATRVISKYGVGVDRIDVAAAGRSNIVVSSTPGVNHRSVAELAFGLLLSLARNIPQQNSAVHAGKWKRLTGIELYGKTLGIIGVGRVGREVALRAMAFGMNVIGFNSSWPRSQVDWVRELNSVFQNSSMGAGDSQFKYVRGIEPLLQESDFISLHMNLTRENQGFLDRSKISLCRPGVLIINVSRAGLVDARALVDGLGSGHVGGYAADVLAQEAVADDEPLRGMRNVILTPHVGSRTVESVERQGTLALENVLRVLNPKSLAESGESIAWPAGALCNLPRGRASRT
ncbi:MAG: phosphoglycerate dehydrogenase [Oligoflexia bacterium]|nr:phosphoglycerate dehydrogenase [Oligoflexia bacterium]